MVRCARGSSYTEAAVFSDWRAAPGRALPLVPCRLCGARALAPAVGVMLIAQLRACFWLLNRFPWSPEKWTKLVILLGPGK